MIDKYLWGDVSRISPEAPVPVVKLKKTSLIAGGAANVAANIAGLGAKAYLVGVIGDDSDGAIFPEILGKANVSANYLLKTRNRQTTIKTRIIAHNQQVVRVDQETNEPLCEEDENRVLSVFENLLEEVNVIAVSDYNKGFLSKNLLSRLITSGKKRHKIILVDPKGRDFFKYSGANIITPNKLEVSEVCGINGNEGEMLEAGKGLLQSLMLEALLVTRGEEGMTLFENNKEPVHLKALARNVYDVTGAGDTVIATLAVALGAGKSFLESAEIANAAAGLVVEEVGTTIIKIENLKRELRKPQKAT